VEAVLKTMLAAQVNAPGAAFQLVEIAVPVPGPKQVRIKVQACGVCHSDSLTKLGELPGIQYPRVPGHEVVGTIDELGPFVLDWESGQRVGVGWFGGHCGRCEPCRRGRLINCIRLETPGVTYDGGYAQYMVAPQEALAKIPDSLTSVDAAPLLCAGVTTFNALRHCGAGPGAVVAIHGIGGLGHLAIQFARQFGFTVVAIGRGQNKRELAGTLGAHRYLDTDRENAANALTEIGGAKAILATAPSGKAIASLIDGMAFDGTLVLIAISPEPIEMTSMQLITGRSIAGWPSGTSIDSQDALKFAAATGVRPMIETFPLARVSEAYEQMISGRARFRAVLTMEA
jgi:D-arabinose 1-dehydrogenase-like Zn-dependent alcohol dehydrogenase